MIRTSKHIISQANQRKLTSLDSLFVDYKHDLEIYINYIIDGILPLKPNLSSSLLSSENIKHSRYKQLIYKQASEIVRSQIDKSKKRRFSSYKKIYSYMMKNHPNSSFVKLKFSDLKLKSIFKTRFFTNPNLNNISINLDERFFNIKDGYHFDIFVNLKLPYFNEKGTRSLQINIPLNHHKHSLKFKHNMFKLRNNIQIKKINGNYFISLIWEKQIDLKPNGKTIGLDMGYKKLVVTSDNQFVNGNLTEIYNNISNKKQGSKSFKRSLTHRDNEINRLCNTINIVDVNKIVIEDLKSVKTGKKYFTNKIQRWSYAKTIDTINRICEVNGIELVKVSPSYTSQTCSSCGHVDKDSRKNEKFLCTCCGYEIDADINASVNILNKGIYSSSNQ
jgi:IS605 OrfB family transposase